MRAWSAATLIGATAMVAGCTPTVGLLKPQWQVQGESPWKGPGVQVLIDHLTCQLIRDYGARPDWKRLRDYNFVAAINLNLIIQNNEMFNPAFSVVRPLTGTGAPINPVVSSGSSVTPTTFNHTLSVSGQFTGAQTNSITYVYQLDMRRLAIANDYQELLARDEAIITGLEYSPAQKDLAKIDEANLRATWADVSPTVEWCRGEAKTDSGVADVLKGDLLQGDLGLRETIGDGLGTLDAIAPFSVYGGGGPTNPSDAIALADSIRAREAQGPPKRGEDKRSLELFAQQQLNLGPLVAPQALAAMMGAGPAGGSKGAGGGAPSAAAATSIGAVVTFNVVLGAGGGPTWSLLKFKGPVSGGSAQLINYNRNATDALTVSLSPTCRSNAEEPLTKIAAPPDEAAPPTGTTWFDFSAAYVDPWASPPPGQAAAPISVTGRFSIPAAPPTSTPPTGVITLDEAGGSGSSAPIAWTFNPTGKDQYRIVGSVSSPALGSAGTIGNIVLWGSFDATAGAYHLEGYVSDDVFIRLANLGPTRSYWTTIPGCDTVTGDYVQQVVNAAAAQAAILTTQSRLGTSH